MAILAKLRKPKHGIQTPGELRAHLQIALEIEHAVIPPYLCALYSTYGNANMAGAGVIREVVIEEMLHMALVANVLNAIGGSPSLLARDFIPHYPAPLPHGERKIILSLRKFSPEALASFLEIEHPSAPHAPPEADHYATIGQFYAAVQLGLETVAANEPGLFNQDPARQVTEAYYYNSGGEPTMVTDLQSARRALETIVWQGEGHRGIYDEHTPPGHIPELAHYFRFNQVYTGRFYQEGDTPESGPTGAPFPVSWREGVYPMRPNPKTADYPAGSELWHLSNAFNIAYHELLEILDQAFNGEPPKLVEAVPKMFEARYRAEALLRVPAGEGVTAGPSFEYPEAAADSAPPTAADSRYTPA